jgi:hypothetical protein
MLPSSFEKELPPVSKMAVNFARDMAAFGAQLLSGGELIIGEEEIAARTRVCLHCPGDFFRHTDYRCAHEACGCFLKLKIPLASASCPLYAWPGDLAKRDK